MDKKETSAYNKMYKGLKAKRSAGKPPKPYNTIEDRYLIDRHKNTPMVVYPTSLNFKGTDEPVVCSHFGCKNHLPPEQQLYGTKCIHHQKQKPIDVAKYVSYPTKKQHKIFAL